MTIAALGRPFALGMLYDARSDKLIVGITMWQDSALKQHVKRVTNPFQSSDVITSETMSDKFARLDVSGSLKLSVLAGLVDLKASGKYLKDNRESTLTSRVSLLSKTRSHMDTLTMEHLATEQLQYTAQVSNMSSATHVVTGIEYGSDAAFVFSKNVSSKIESAQMEGSLQAALQKIAFSIDGTAQFSSGEHAVDELSGFTCSFFGDLNLPQMPTTFKDAIQVYQNLPRFIKEQKPVPKTIHLYPLVKLDSQSARLVRQISITLTTEAESIIQAFIDFRCHVNGFITMIDGVFAGLTKEFLEMRNLVSQAETIFQHCLIPLLIHIRGTGVAEEKLAHYIYLWKSSPFSTENLEKCSTTCLISQQNSEEPGK
ncbi:hypothetical protein HK100_011423 [Physocladia obscura]|uniref:Uncharacterized protein n=1 Tax=Physocladia obscura TaxID=109957 RepID=A0AAD5XE65_9FUNG|nr:hypothetical protein HK100_011423 [Physocladia obscura]